MVEEHPRLHDLRRLRPDRLLGVEDVLPVLAAPGVRGVGGREERERTLDAVVGHLPERVGEERVPVAVAEVDRQVDAVGVELRSESRDQRPVLGVDRADAAEERVVVRDLLEPLAGDVAPARDVLEERDHVVHPLRPAERDDEDRVEARGREVGDEPVGGCPGNGFAHRSERSRAGCARRGSASG